MDEMQASGQDALTFWQHMFPRAAAFQGPLAFAASAAALGHFIAGTDTRSGRVATTGDARVGFLVGGMLMGAQLPYTLKVLMPLNRQLLLKDANAQSGEWKSAKVRLWGHLHHARTAASVAAFGLMLYQVFGRASEE